jgi:hypothetical protein
MMMMTAMPCWLAHHVLLLSRESPLIHISSYYVHNSALTDLVFI